MSIECQEIGKVTLISVEGNLDVHSAPRLLETIEDLVEKEQVRIVVDMSHVDFISSYGLGVLANSLKTLKQKGGLLKLASIKPEVRVPFEVTGLLPRFSVFSTSDEAVASFT